MQEDHKSDRLSIPPSHSRYTSKQGQYLAYIHLYTKLNRCPPAEREIQRFFKVTPPTVHRMVIELETKGLISRVPGKARSIRILLSPSDLPDLEDVN
ncbi:MAG: MarR family transcriptional regulator [Nitrososphaerales archaeon]|jgi:DNA-binding MarR family transcriptional regulator